jgi:REP element-mobilizing transposase RayT
MNRGRRAENIFSAKTDYQVFIELLKECSELWNVNISAFCLMPNHYHLLIQTQDANLSRCMRHLNGVYTQRYNRSHHCDGQLFRGRYKSILVDEDSYLLQLVRYIHRNPLRAGLIDNMGLSLEQPQRICFAVEKVAVAEPGFYSFHAVPGQAEKPEDLPAVRKSGRFRRDHPGF